MRIPAMVAAALCALCVTPLVPADTTVVTAARMVDVLAGREVERPQIVRKGGVIGKGTIP